MASLSDTLTAVNALAETLDKLFTVAAKPIRKYYCLTDHVKDCRMQLEKCQQEILSIQENNELLHHVQERDWNNINSDQAEY